MLVQPSAYGLDNSRMLDAMQKPGPVCSGIADIDHSTPDVELTWRLVKRIDRMETCCAEFGRQLDFLLPGRLTEILMDRLTRLKVNFTLAHMSMFAAANRPENAGFKKLLYLLQHGDGRCWVKLPVVYRWLVKLAP